MGELDFEKLLAGEGVGRDSVPAGIYTFNVVDARSTDSKKETSKGVVFLTCEVQDGPEKGEISELSINIPGEDASRGAKFFFARKMAGFGLPSEIGQAMNQSDNPAAILAESLVDVTFEAEVGVNEDEGPYKGSNDLISTKPADTPAPKAAKSDVAAVSPGVSVEDEAAAATETVEDDEELPF